MSKIPPEAVAVLEEAAVKLSQLGYPRYVLAMAGNAADEHGIVPVTLVTRMADDPSIFMMLDVIDETVREIQGIEAVEIDEEDLASGRVLN